MQKIALFLIITSIIFRSQAQYLPPINWDELNKTEPWRITEVKTDVPTVTPGKQGIPPSDAIVLFDGTDLSQWEKTPFGEGVLMERTAAFLKSYQSKKARRPADWSVDKGEIVVGQDKGAIATKQAFGDMQLHIEWKAPKLDELSGQGYGNSGIFLMGLYEIQVLNSYENETYSNGQAGAVYKQHVPLVNATTPPETWQTYDIIFTAPRFTQSGQVASSAKVTVLHNGVLIQNNAKLEGPTVFIGKSYYVKHPDKLPIVLQDHDNPVRYRNIWVREL